MLSFWQPLGLQAYKSYLLWRLKYANITCSGLFGAPETMQQVPQISGGFSMNSTWHVVTILSRNPLERGEGGCQPPGCSSWPYDMLLLAIRIQASSWHAASPALDSSCLQQHFNFLSALSKILQLNFTKKGFEHWPQTPGKASTKTVGKNLKNG